MALPKRRHSNARTRKRRTHWVLTLPSIGHCKRCNAVKPSHQVCPSCGFYGGEKMIDVKE